MLSVMWTLFVHDDIFLPACTATWALLLALLLTTTTSDHCEVRDLSHLPRMMVGVQRILVSETQGGL